MIIWKPNESQSKTEKMQSMDAESAVQICQLKHSDSREGARKGVGNPNMITNPDFLAASSDVF